MKIQFIGAAGTVTGSKVLVEHKGTRLLVDCGLYQGIKSNRLMNWRPLAVPIDSIDAILLTHAHIDHSGFIPVLTKHGYGGPVFCTAPTRDLCGILLPDCGYLQEEDARYANLKGFSKHKPALALYTEKDGREALKRFRVIALNERFNVGPFSIEYRSAGHILGAANIRVEADGADILFSGDVGRYDDLLEHPPDTGPGAHHVVLESTYGDRLHPAVDPIKKLGKIITDTAERGGTLVIPSFAVGRAQTLMYAIHQAIDRGMAPNIPVFLNSPMATEVTQLYRRYLDWHGLNEDQCNAACARVQTITTVEESKGLHQRRGPMIIISASGMLTGGRVLHHVAHFGPDPKNTILLAGFQAPGTRGAVLAAGGRNIKMHGSHVVIKAQVRQLHCLSAHADQNGLLRWLASLGRKPETIFLNHGEPQAIDQLRQRIEESMAARVEVPRIDQSYEIA